MVQSLQSFVFSLISLLLWGLLFSSYSLMCGNPLMSIFVLLFLCLWGFYSVFIWGSIPLIGFLLVFCTVGGIVVVFSFIIVSIATFFRFTFNFNWWVWGLGLFSGFVCLNPLSGLFPCCWELSGFVLCFVFIFLNFVLYYSSSLLLESNMSMKSF